ncbi:hypothetical protein [Gelidibacter sp.]|uniref:hypothetical protein n=1 Tax=Gelidibacter sp. TaxID=2018083 RepID=UPI0032637929
MQTILKKINLTIILLIVTVSVCSAQKNKKANNDTEAWRYEIEAVQTGTQGSYLIKVWSYSKKPDVAIEQAKKNAVHGIIFRGFIGSQSVAGQKPLANNGNLEVEKEDFFKSFFANGGKYMKFVSMSHDGAVAAGDRMKVGKEYKVGVVVSVNVSTLRKDLEDAGVIKALGSGFN